MNKQSNTYTIFYIIAMVVVVGTALAFTAMALKDKQQENINTDKMKQILAAIHVSPSEGKIQDDFNKYIVKQLVVNSDGDIMSNNAFDIDMAKESRITDARQRRLPVFICNLPDGTTKYILPVYGAGLWGPIWGYIAINDDGSSIYGAYFAHQGETPGLGAEIDKPEFGNKFIGKNLMKNNEFIPISVIKAGQTPTNGSDYVDGISGGTITSKGVNDMLSDCLLPYKAFLESINKN